MKRASCLDVVGIVSAMGALISRGRIFVPLLWICWRCVGLRWCNVQAGLTSAVGVSSGFGSPVFAACFVLLLIIAYDATGVRREAGKHAGV